MRPWCEGKEREDVQEQTFACFSLTYRNVLRLAKGGDVRDEREIHNVTRERGRRFLKKATGCDGIRKKIAESSPSRSDSVPPINRS